MGGSHVSGAQNHKSLLLRVPACLGPPQEQTHAAVVGEDRALRGPGAGLRAKASCYISPRAPRGVSIAPHSLWPPAHRCASPRMGALSRCPALLWALVALLSVGTAGKDAAPHSPRTAGAAPAGPEWTACLPQGSACPGLLGSLSWEKLEPQGKLRILASGMGGTGAG